MLGAQSSGCVPDANGAGDADDDLMAPPKRPLVIEVEPGHDPPTGRVDDTEGARHTFTGWLGLATALGRALRAGASDHERPRPAGTPVEPAATGSPSTEREAEQPCN